MRLIHTSNLTLHEFSDKDIPPYAILSHRWDSTEVSFYEFSSVKAQELPGWKKIEGCCQKAASDGWKYVWIDSCCIDKTSSAELSEAINSMFSWYHNSEICYAYLSDVPDPNTQTRPPEIPFSKIQQSKWFTRGWTLQELLAPRWVEFLSTSWIDLGTKSSLASVIERTTGINHLFNFRSASIAQKMSWAARRETTRIEDQAYCLMGLFDVNMPLLYGEGLSAFIRLQLEIISKSDDETIFAWNDPSADFGPGVGLLATSPGLFKGSGNVQRGFFDKWRPEYAMTNKGLRLELQLLPNYKQVDYIRAPAEYLAPLNCTIRTGPQTQSTVALRLIRKMQLDKYYTYARQGRLETHELVGKDQALKSNDRTVVFVEQPNWRPPILHQGLVEVAVDLKDMNKFGFNLQGPYRWPIRVISNETAHALELQHPDLPISASSESYAYARFGPVAENNGVHMSNIDTIGKGRGMYPRKKPSTDQGTSIEEDQIVITADPQIFNFVGLCFDIGENGKEWEWITLLIGVSKTRAWVEILKRELRQLDKEAEELGWPLGDEHAAAHKDRVSCVLREDLVLDVRLRRKTKESDGMMRYSITMEVIEGDL